MKISAVVLTKNEEKNIGECLSSLTWCDELVVIDDESKDQTLAIAKKHGAKVYQRRLNHDFASQRNFGLKKAQSEWILFVDADERVTPKLEAEIKVTIKSSTAKNGYWLKRQDYFGGRLLKHGEMFNFKIIRLGRKNKGQWFRKVHETWKIQGEVGLLKSPLIHHPHQTLTEYLNEINRYSTLHSEALSAEGQKSGVTKIVFKPLGKFIVNYFMKLGFLDQMPGMVVAMMMSFHSFLAWSKLWLNDQKLASNQKKAD